MSVSQLDLLLEQFIGLQPHYLLPGVQCYFRLGSDLNTSWKPEEAKKREGPLQSWAALRSPGSQPFGEGRVHALR